MCGFEQVGRFIRHFIILAIDVVGRSAGNGNDLDNACPARVCDGRVEVGVVLSTPWTRAEAIYAEDSCCAFRKIFGKSII